MNGQTNMYGGQAPREMTPFDVIMSALQAKAMKADIAYKNTMTPVQAEVMKSEAERNRIISKYLPDEIMSRVNQANAEAALNKGHLDSLLFGLGISQELRPKTMSALSREFDRIEQETAQQTTTAPATTRNIRMVNSVMPRTLTPLRRSNLYGRGW